MFWPTSKIIISTGHELHHPHYAHFYCYFSYRLGIERVNSRAIKNHSLHMTFVMVVRLLQVKGMPYFEGNTVRVVHQLLQNMF